MDYNAFVEIFNREFGEDFELERGCSYSMEILLAKSSTSNRRVGELDYLLF